MKVIAIFLLCGLVIYITNIYSSHTFGKDKRELNINEVMIGKSYSDMFSTLENVDVDVNANNSRDNIVNSNLDNNRIKRKTWFNSFNFRTDFV